MAQLKLPQEWLQIQLGDVASYGKTQKCELSDVTDDTWVLELEDIEKDSSRIISRKTAKERPFKSTKNRFERGNVLYGKLRPYLNKVIVADTDGVCTTEIIPLDSEPFVLNRYLFHWFKTRNFLNYVNDVSYGVNMPRLGTKDGVAAPFILAPLAEQKVIADKLDTLLAQVENTKARLERIPQILKRFRQSVLAAAVSGRLTEEWRGNCTYADFEVGDETVSTPSNWSSSDIGGIIDGSRKLCYGVVQPGPEVSGGTPLIRVCDIQQGEIDWGNLRSISLQIDDQYRRSKVKQGDILVTIVGAIGRVGIVRDNTDANIARAVARISPNESLVHPFYVHCWLSSPTMQWWLVNSSKEVARKTLNLKELKTAPIPLPPLEEQTEIVRRVDQLFAHADRIEQQVNNALARVNNLTQSILAKAFRGELTEQWRKDNPELISGENSAEALLERIKAERAAVKPAKKTRKRAKS